ncbi:MAG: restriction endonuclease [Caldilineaceae bacterium]|nr:restriction endonuclease [Caldilineaceae bacterium]
MPDETSVPMIPSNGGLTFLDCAQKVLEEFGGDQPLHYKVITETARKQGWLVTAGKTPENTMYAQIVTAIKRQQARGEPPRFVQHGRGYFSLSQRQDPGLVSLIEQHNQQVRQALRKRLLALAPQAFEELMAQLLAAMGFERVEVSELGGDRGIDVRGTLVVEEVIRIRMAVQVKKWQHNIHSPVVQQVCGSLGAHEQGLIITTSNFSKGAIQEAQQADKTPIALMNSEQLVTLLMEHGIGVRRTTPDLFEIDENFASGGTEQGV